MDCLIDDFGFNYEVYGGKFIILYKKMKEGRREMWKLWKYICKIEKLDVGGNLILILIWKWK